MGSPLQRQKNKPKLKHFAFLTAFLSQIVRARRCDIKTSLGIYGCAVKAYQKITRSFKY